MLRRILSREERESGVVAKRDANSASLIFCQSSALISRGSNSGATCGAVAIGARRLYGQHV